MLSALWSQPTQQVKRKTGNMDEKYSLIKIKLYLFSSTDAYQWQDQRQLPVEDKKGGSSTGPPTYVSSFIIRSKSITLYKCQKTSNLEEQGMIDICQSGALPRKRGWNPCTGRGWWIGTLDGTGNICLMKSAPQDDEKNRRGAVTRIGATKTVPGTIDAPKPQVVHKG